MVIVERVAEAILLTQKIREESFNKEQSNKLEQSDHMIKDFNKCYQTSLHNAADKAVEQLGFDKRMAQPIYLLCKYTWNDIQDWATELLRI